MKSNMKLLLVWCHFSKVLRWLRRAFAVIVQTSLLLFLTITVLELVKVKQLANIFLFLGVIGGGSVLFLLQVIYQIAVRMLEGTLIRQIEFIISNMGTNIEFKKFYKLDSTPRYLVDCEGKWFQNESVVEEMHRILDAMARALHNERVYLHLRISGDSTLMRGKMDQ